MASSFLRGCFFVSLVTSSSIPALADPSGTGRDVRRVNIALREGQQQMAEVKVEVAPPEPPPAEPEEPSPPDPVEPPPPPPPSPPLPPKPASSASRSGRWVFEIGTFGAYMTTRIGYAQPEGGDSRVLLQGVTAGEPPSSCGEQTCAYRFGRTGGFVGGVNLFTGFAASDRVHFGGRLLAGPRAGAGGMLFATGPSVSIHVGGPLWVGASMFVGIASLSESGSVTPPPTHYLVGGPYVISGSTDAAFGLGAEMRVELFRTARGALSLDTHPFFLAGAEGTAFVLPIGVSYRFH